MIVLWEMIFLKPEDMVFRMNLTYSEIEKKCYINYFGSDLQLFELSQGMY